MNDEESGETTALLKHPVAPVKKEMLGLLSMALSAIFFSLMSVLVKVSGTDFPVMQIVFSRSLIQMIAAAIYCICMRMNPFGPCQKRKLLFFRGLAGSVSLAIYFFVLVNMPLGDGITLFFVNPAFTAVAASIFLNEPFTWMDLSSVIICLAGVAFVSRPQFLFGSSELNPHYPLPVWIPTSLALFSALISALAYCIVRAVGKSVHFMIHVFYFGFISTLFSGFMLYSGLCDDPLPIFSWTIDQWMCIFGVGAFAFMAQCCLNYGLQLSNAGPATLMRNLDVVFAFLFGLLIFDEKLNFFSVLGASMIVGGTAFVVLVKWYQTL